MAPKLHKFIKEVQMDSNQIRVIKNDKGTYIEFPCCKTKVNSNDFGGPFGGAVASENCQKCNKLLSLKGKSFIIVDNDGKELYRKPPIC